MKCAQQWQPPLRLRLQNDTPVRAADRAVVSFRDSDNGPIRKKERYRVPGQAVSKRNKASAGNGSHCFSPVAGLEKSSYWLMGGFGLLDGLSSRVKPTAVPVAAPAITTPAMMALVPTAIPACVAALATVCT